MEFRQEIIEKTLKLLQGMEWLTGFHPGDKYYTDIVESLNNLSETELPEKFIQITQIITQSIDSSVQDIADIKKESIRNEESLDHLKELNEIASILNF